MCTVIFIGGDQLIGLHVDADAQHALGFLRRFAERIAVRGRGDTDFPCSLADGEWRAELRKRRRAKQRGAHKRTPHRERFCHRSFSVAIPPANPAYTPERVSSWKQFLVGDLGNGHCMASGAGKNPTLGCGRLNMC